MVNQIERKDDADYSLQRLADLASRQAIAYSTTSSQRDIDNLGYDRATVCDCLLALRAVHFCHSERYRRGGTWHDVYKIDWAPEGSAPDPLYVKFRMDDDLLVIELCSFHLKRFQ